MTDPVHLVDRERIIRLVQEMVRIPSQYAGAAVIEHRAIAEYLARQMKEMGCQVDVLEPMPEFPVVIGTTPRGDKGPTIGVLGHYNTVPVGNPEDWTHDPFAGEVVDGRIYGRGAVDAKGMLAVMMTAVQCLMDSGLQRKGRVRLIMIPGEGVGEKVLELLVSQEAEAMRCDMYFDTGGGPGQITFAYGGYLWLELVTKGTPVHSVNPTPDGRVPINPIGKMVDVLARLRNPDWMTAAPHPYFGPPYGRHSAGPVVELTVFQAGTNINMIPREARSEIDIRPVPGQNIEGILGELDDVLAHMRQADPALDVSYSVLHTPVAPSSPVPPDHPIVRVMQETCSELGHPARINSSPAGRPALAKFGPAVHFGAAAGGNAHAPDEYALIDDLILGAQLHTRLYTKLVT